jgi:hypothetical protein
VMEVVAGCGCESQPLVETTNRIPTAIVRFNRPRIAVDHTVPSQQIEFPVPMSWSLFYRHV